MNGYILYKLLLQLRIILAIPVGHESTPAALKIEGGGPLFRILKGMFRLIDRPWKMYPLGVLFGLGFDTSSEIALLGISSIQASKGTSIWLIMVFPALFTAGMCLIDTIDGALMLAVYVGPMTASGVKGHDVAGEDHIAADLETSMEETGNGNGEEVREGRLKDPIMFLYYSIVLTSLTVMVALIIGTIQLLTLILNVTKATGPFWKGVHTVGDDYEIIGGAICGSFIVIGGVSVLCYKPWRRRVEEKRMRRDALRGADARDENEEGVVEEIEVEVVSKDQVGKGAEADSSSGDGPRPGAGPSRSMGLLDERIEPV